MGHYCKSFCVFFHCFIVTILCDGLDTMFPNQTIVPGHTLISPNQMFEMGFFSPGSSKNIFLGIWYTSMPDVVVWVANRNNPLRDSQSVQLAVDGNGTLAIVSTRGIIVLSTNSSGLMSEPVVQLLDNGNLVVMDQSVQSYTWQSFDHPTDTWLPGMKIVHDIDAGVEKYLISWKNSDDPSFGDFVSKITNKGLPQIVIFEGTRKIYRSGTWNGQYFSGGVALPTPLMERKMSFKEERLISWTMINLGSTSTRLTLDKSGSIQRWALNPQANKWTHMRSYPSHRCDEYGLCGPNGMCTPDVDIKYCECPKGFTPKVEKYWDLLDWSGGCTRITPLDCSSEDHGFLEITGVKYPDVLDHQFFLNLSMNLNECRSKCLRNCRCVAFANPYITNGGSGCLMWFGELIDMRILYGAQSSKQKMYIRLLNSELDSRFDLEEDVHNKNRPMLSILLASIVSSVLVSCFINYGIYRMVGRKRQGDKTDVDMDVPLYNLATITSATNNFSQENLLGEGGFGHVYKGNLSTEVQIAVKRLSKKSRQGLAEFKNEAMLIAKLQHRNLVRLLGCCVEKEENILIYEYMRNKSLDTFIFDQNQRTFLTWPKRFEIIIGIARGLLYLHHDSRLKVIHRDLKTSNILLDDDLSPKISDFGLAKTFVEDQFTARTTIIGTYGYMSPEYTTAGNLSTKCDIFSFGVILLEILSGKKNRDSLNNSQYYYSLLGLAWFLWKESKPLELMDECFKNTFVGSQVVRCVQIGLLCVQKHPEDRPDMISVYSMLSTNEGTLPEPKEPGFFIERNYNVVKSHTSTSLKMDNGTMSISDVEAR